MAGLICQQCGKPLIRRPLEQKGKFEKRKYCNLQCCGKALSVSGEPVEAEEFLPTQDPPGSEGKIEVLRRRVALGHPLWHEHDFLQYGSTKND